MITFQSEVGPDVMMFDDVAKHMFVILGKEPTARGVITVEQLPEAILRLEAAIASDHAATAQCRDQEADEGDEEEAGRDAGAKISLTRRAFPLLELLRLSLARGKPVLWGV